MDRKKERQLFIELIFTPSFIEKIANEMSEMNEMKKKHIGEMDKLLGDALDKYIDKNSPSLGEVMFVLSDFLIDYVQANCDIPEGYDK